MRPDWAEAKLLIVDRGCSLAPVGDPLGPRRVPTRRREAAPRRQDGRHPLANFRVGLHGVFENEADSYDPARHHIAALASAGVQLRRAIREQAQVSKAEGLLLPPNPIRYYDITTGQENAAVTPGHTAWLYGYRLRVDLADPRQGIYFLDAAETAVRVEEVTWNMPGRLIFVNPALSAGEYRLEVRALNYAGDEVQTGVLPDKLVVS